MCGPAEKLSKIDQMLKLLREISDKLDRLPVKSQGDRVGSAFPYYLPPPSKSPYPVYAS